MNNKYTEGKPNNYEELKNDANNRSSWRTRLEAVKELSKWKCQESKDILWRRMNSDDVYSVKHAAFLGLQSFGENVKLPKKKSGNLIKDINKNLAKIKNSLPEGHDFSEFKEKFKQTKPVEYDTYDGDKGNKLDSWLENVWKSLPKK
ncbi:HEAT repeat domain-containing protein [Paenibacillus gallinarum]|uniref:HEAT repeat domain-containing protein n=1 Tax=Paenibacillus gallinarum TaxID=2762232 RepID=A0ABR8SW81_9BACL|nr:HEAT repeat domain-containing protein [Paenibacillus gallinarum]MBD7967745.1 HEAT repeat domain-containing protein [Paenibacillus gallinarum]